jgi:hypothetical protein
MVGMFDTDETRSTCAKLDRAVEARSARQATRGGGAALWRCSIGGGREGTASDRQTLLPLGPPLRGGWPSSSRRSRIFEDIHLAA